MKRLFSITLAAVLCTAAFAQNQTIYQFTAVRDIPVTSVKDQARTGTCWCFATVSFLEAELLRQGKGEYDLSEMFIVRHNYDARIFDNYLRRGNGNINPGSIAHMATQVVSQYGIVPESVYHGINYDSPGHDHSELSSYLKGIAEASVNLKRLSPEYNKLVKSLFDIYLGELPETFKYNGKSYTPDSFARSIGLDHMEDYIELTSFSHHPFYQQVPLEIPDNWDHALLWNVPLDDMMAIIDNALTNGYTVAWDGDLTAGEFQHQRGIAICPEQKDLKEAMKLEKIFPERTVTQETRQQDFETFRTVDDHLMHLTGLYKDQNGTPFYKTKNSWGEGNDLKGYLFMSKAYVQMRTVSIMVHRDAIPKDIRKKLGL
jgi:bleomycin hydrolase